MLLLLVSSSADPGEAVADFDLIFVVDFREEVLEVDQHDDADLKEHVAVADPILAVDRDEIRVSSFSYFAFSYDPEVPSRLSHLQNQIFLLRRPCLSGP